MRKLTDHDLTNLAGATLQGYHVEGIRIKRGSFTDSDHYGIVLGRNANGNYVTWQFHLDENEQPSVYWGHYFFEDRDAALRDFNNRDVDAKPFKVTITESLKLTVEVEAKDPTEAEQLVSDSWRNEQYVLTADNFAGAEFTACRCGLDIPAILVIRWMLSVLLLRKSTIIQVSGVGWIKQWQTFNANEERKNKK
jgi:hypothetical protein